MPGGVRAAYIEGHHVEGFDAEMLSLDFTAMSCHVHWLEPSVLPLMLMRVICSVTVALYRLLLVGYTT